MGRWKPTLPYHGPTRQWKKVCKGKTYYLGAAKSKSDRESHDRALAKWEQIKAEINAEPEPEKPNQQDYEFAIDRWEKMARWYRRVGREENAARCDQKAAALRKRLARREPPPLERTELDPTKSGVEKNHEVWAQRFEELDHSLPVDKTVGGQITSWLEELVGQVSIDVITADRFESYRCCINNFGGWVGKSEPVETISEATVSGYYNHLVQEVGNRKRDRRNKDGCSASYASDQFATAKQFITWCWEKGLIDLPRNIKSRKHRFNGRKGKSKKAYFENEELLLLLNEAPERLKLYLLLMMNCGYTQSDLSDLTHDEIDWTEGRIIRQRSKTGDDDEESNVPEVNYLLWPETFRLLRKHRSNKQEYDTVFVTEKGGLLVPKRLRDDNTLSKTDNIQSMYRRLQTRLKLKDAEKKPLKSIRKTSADRIGKNRDYMILKSHFLGHSARTVAAKHYSDSVSQTFLDECVRWLGKDYGLPKAWLKR